MSRTIASLLSAVVGLALLAGCGGSDDASDSSVPPSSIADADFVEVLATNYGLFTDADANTCVGQAFLDLVGLDQLTATETTPTDLAGIIMLDDAGLTVSADDVPAAVDDLTKCGDLASIALASGSATPAQNACAAEVVTNELAAEQLIVQVSTLEPSDELAAAREALQACAAD